MNGILAPPACPPWCSGGHLPADDGRVHISREQILPATSGPEQRELYVSLERADSGLAGQPNVRLEGASSAPMTPAQAMQLATALQVAAFTAVTGEQAAA